MAWEAWVLVVFYASTVLVNIGTIGRVRKPSTPGDVVALTIVAALICWLVLRLAGVL